MAMSHFTTVAEFMDLGFLCISPRVMVCDVSQRVMAPVG